MNQLLISVSSVLNPFSSSIWNCSYMLEVK